jgi:hypothetical protein
MPDIEQWLADTAQRLDRRPSATMLDEIDHRIVREPLPQVFVARREIGRSMLFAGAAALLGFGITGTSATFTFAKAAPTWVAAPSASSPFSLLVGG